MNKYPEFPMPKGVPKKLRIRWEFAGPLAPVASWLAKNGRLGVVFHVEVDYVPAPDLAAEVRP